MTEDKTTTLMRTGLAARRSSGAPWIGALMLLGAPCLAAATPVDGAAPVPHGTWAQEGLATSAEGEPELVIRTRALARWALEGEATRDRLQERLDDVAAVASGAGRVEWNQAAPADALVEAAVLAGLEQRVMLLAAAAEWQTFTPTPAHARALRCAAIELAEPLTQLEGQGARWSLFIRRTLEDLRDPLDGSLDPFGEAVVARLERLATGTERPRFIARDAAGNEVRSADFDGTVTVFRFWSAESPASVHAHTRDAALVRRHWDAPFALVGLSAHTDREEYLTFLGHQSFGGTQVFDGPISTKLADELAKDAGRLVQTGASGEPVAASPAWGRPLPGTVVVVDAQGIVRGRDLPAAQLDELVTELIREARTRVQGTPLPGGQTGDPVRRPSAAHRSEAAETSDRRVDRRRSGDPRRATAGAREPRSRFPRRSAR